MSRIAPHSLETERNVLGMVLIAARQVLPEVAPILVAGDFYHPAHRELFQAMVDLEALSEPVDALTVWRRMEGTSKAEMLNVFGGAKYLDELQAEVVTVESVGYHAGVVRSKAERRKWAEATSAIALAAYEGGDDTDFFAEAERKVLELTARRAEERGPRPVRGELAVFRDTVADRYEHRSAGGLTGVPSGFEQFDGITSGLQAADLVIVAARPSMGKTAFCLNIAANAAANDVACLVFSLEMSMQALIERLIAAEGGINSLQLRNGLMNTQAWFGLERAFAKLADRPMWIDDRGAITLAQLRSTARRWRMREAKSSAKAMVVVDYLQLMRAPQKGREANREREIAEISRGLKALAKELDCPVVALSQLNRGVEQRADKRPMMSDLRESGAIEQDADVIAFLYRDEVYHDDTKEPGIAEVIVAKQRCGPTGVVKLGWKPESCRFTDLVPLGRTYA